MRLTLTLTALAAAGASQLLILGPHHSGTSLTARALHEMGIFLGDADDLLLDGSNPNKFWERRDVVRANQKRMRAGVPPNATSPHAPRLPPFVGFGFEPGFGTPIGQDEAARAALAKLVASGQPWATKDPRLSLLASEWLPLLKADAVCVITVRHPLDFASSMLAYAPEVGLGGWSGIWLHYMASALRACALQPLVLIDHGQLIREPAHALEALRARLLHLGVPLPKAAAAAAEASTPPPGQTASGGGTFDATALVARLHLDHPPPRAQWLASELALLPTAAAELSEALTAAVRLPADAPPTLVPPRVVPKTSWPTLPPRHAVAPGCRVHRVGQIVGQG